MKLHKIVFDNHGGIWRKKKKKIRSTNEKLPLSLSLSNQHVVTQTPSKQGRSPSVGVIKKAKSTPTASVARPSTTSATSAFRRQAQPMYHATQICQTEEGVILTPKQTGEHFSRIAELESSNVNLRIIAVAWM